MSRKTKFKLFCILFVAALAPVLAHAQKKSVNIGDWTNKEIEIKKSGTETGSGVLQKVRIGKHENFDRVVFEFGDKALPNGKVRFAKPPFYLGESDQTVKIAGKSFLEISLTPAVAHDIETGKETVKTSESVSGLSALKEIRRIYDFEGQVIYVLGLASQKQFRVQTLSNPTRLIVDVKH